MTDAAAERPDGVPLELPCPGPTPSASGARDSRSSARRPPRAALRRGWRRRSRRRPTSSCATATAPPSARSGATGSTRWACPTARSPTGRVSAGGPGRTPGAAPRRRGSRSTSPDCASPARATCSRSSPLRRRLETEGLFRPQKTQPRTPHPPRTIGVEAGKARDDVLAGPRRRGWRGRWSGVRACPGPARRRRRGGGRYRISRHRRGPRVFARGGGSLADLASAGRSRCCPCP